MLDDSAMHFQHTARELAPVFASRAAKWDETRTYCWENVKDMTDAGLMGMTIPDRFGGKGASYLDAAVVIEELAKACTLSARIMVEANMGGISAVMAYGSDELREFAAPIVLAGDKPAICITEPEAGPSQAGDLHHGTRGGQRCDGNENDSAPCG